MKVGTDTLMGLCDDDRWRGMIKVDHTSRSMRSRSAACLFISCWSMCLDKARPGYVDPSMLEVLGFGAGTADYLVGVGLWEETGGGWQFVDWPGVQRPVEDASLSRINDRRMLRPARPKKAAEQ